HAEAQQRLVERQADSMGLVRCDDRHALQRARKSEFVRDGVLVVVLRNHLLVIRIRPFDEASEHRREWRAKAEMIVTPGDLDLFVFRKEPANLLERLRWHDQIA